MFELIVTILSVAVIAISLWGLMYFSLRFWIHFRLGAMPSADDIQQLLQDIPYLYDEEKGTWHHSPTVIKRPGGGQNIPE
ncbi:MAG TPA: hypothetical protein V6C97_27695 [Oculatellaceae cyanobacterium]